MRICTVAHILHVHKWGVAFVSVCVYTHRLTSLQWQRWCVLSVMKFQFTDRVAGWPCFTDPAKNVTLVKTIPFSFKAKHNCRIEMLERFLKGTYWKRNMDMEPSRRIHSLMGWSNHFSLKMDRRCRSSCISTNVKRLWRLDIWCRVNSSGTKSVSCEKVWKQKKFKSEDAQCLIWSRWPSFPEFGFTLSEISHPGWLLLLDFSGRFTILSFEAVQDSVTFFQVQEHDYKRLSRSQARYINTESKNEVEIWFKHGWVKLYCLEI